MGFAVSLSFSGLVLDTDDEDDPKYVLTHISFSRKLPLRRAHALVFLVFARSVCCLRDRTFFGFGHRNHRGPSNFERVTFPNTYGFAHRRSIGFWLLEVSSSVLRLRHRISVPSLVDTVSWIDKDMLSAKRWGGFTDKRDWIGEKMEALMALCRKEF